MTEEEEIKTKSTKFPGETIKLRVGDKLFKTTREVLTKEKDTFFIGLLSDFFDDRTENHQEYVITRDNTYFQIILDHFEGFDVSRKLKGMSDEELDLFEQEVDFYNIKSLITMISASRKSTSLIIDYHQERILKSFIADPVENDSSSLFNFFIQLLPIPSFSLEKPKSIKSKQSWKLIYRGTRDGFTATDFHSHCDGVKNTISIIKAEDGSILGGYTKKKWAAKELGDFAKDNAAFIFSLYCAADPDREPRKFSKKLMPSCAVYHHFLRGPCFGCDLSLESQWTTSEMRGCCELNDCYDSNLKCKYLAGSHSFGISEIEVYAIKFAKS